MATTSGLLAQNKMLVNLKNGTTIGYSFSEIESVTWEITEQPGDQQGNQQVNQEVNQHEYVDLGLPSGLKWATCNVGATSPEDYGDYFAWGETEGKAYYTWSGYKWCNGSGTTLTKYNYKSDYGTIDTKTVLEPADDAATANWGSSWRMPTCTEFQELKDNCTWTWIWKNSTYGYKVTGTNGNWIFLPAAGQYEGAPNLNSGGEKGTYWSRERHGYDPSYAYYLLFDIEHVTPKCNYYRYSGRSVRPVTE